MTRDIQPFADSLYQEMLGHIKQTDLGVPVRRGAYSYYSRMRKGSSTRSIAEERRLRTGHSEVRAPRTVLLDVNELAKGFKFFSVGDFEISDDGNCSPTRPIRRASGSTGCS